MENFFFYVPKFKILGAKFAPYMSPSPRLANGSLDCYLSWGMGHRLLRSGGFALADTWFRTGKSWLALSRGQTCGRDMPLWRPPAATRRAPQLMWVPVTGATTSTVRPPFTSPRTRAPRLNIMGNWEIHGSKTARTGDISTMFGTLPINVQLTPGAAWSDEWGLGQAIPLDRPFLKTKKITKVAQIGLIGYDQAQALAQQKQQHSRRCL